MNHAYRPPGRLSHIAFALMCAATVAMMLIYEVTR
jgi:hypothetical protein